MNSAPSVPYVMVVPESAVKSELLPCVKSTETVLPRAVSLGHAVHLLVCEKCAAKVHT